MKITTDETIKSLNSMLNILCRYKCSHEHDPARVRVMRGDYTACKTCVDAAAVDMAVEALEEVEE